MTVSDADLEDLLAMVDRGRQAWVDGVLGCGEGLESGDLVVIVLVERNDAVVEGSDDPQRWVLRTTQVFEKRAEGWVRLHRHADPLISRRSPSDTFAIARG